MKHREIKFKLYFNGKIMGYEIHATDEETGEILIKHIALSGKVTIINLGCEAITHDHKARFTGMKDRNGVDVYEDDVIEYSVTCDAKITVVTGYIKVKDWWFVLCDNNGPDILIGYYVCSVKVVGNIFQEKFKHLRGV